MTITCKHCKETVDVSMYFYNHCIFMGERYMTSNKEYTAFVRGKAICPCCGSEINKAFESTISYKDIEKLAIGKEDNK